MPLRKTRRNAQKITTAVSLAEAHGVDAVGRNAGGHEQFAQRLRAAFAERAVVFFRAALVAVAFDEQVGRGVLGFELRGDLRHFRGFAGFHVRAVILEVHRLRGELRAVLRTAINVARAGIGDDAVRVHCADTIVAADAVAAGNGVATGQSAGGRVADSRGAAVAGERRHAVHFLFAAEGAGRDHDRQEQGGECIESHFVF